MSEDTPTSQRRVARTFNDYLQVGVGLPTVQMGPEDVFLGRRESWSGSGFWISYRIDPDDAGHPSLELYVHCSFMDDWRARIWADGYLEELPRMRLWFGFDHTVRGSVETARRELLDRNRTILLRLIERGLIPKDHVHDFQGSADEPPLQRGQLLGFPIQLAHREWKERP